MSAVQELIIEVGDAVSQTVNERLQEGLLMIHALPNAKSLIADKGYDAGWFRAALAERGIVACIPSKANRKTPGLATSSHTI